MWRTRGHYGPLLPGADRQETLVLKPTHRGLNRDRADVEGADQCAPVGEPVARREVSPHNLLPQRVYNSVLNSRHVGHIYVSLARVS